MRSQAEPLRGACGELHLLDGPDLPRLRIAVHLGRRKAIEGEIIRRMHGDELALEMRRQLRDNQAGLGEDAAQLVAVILALRRALQVDEARIPARDLNALVAMPGRPLRDAAQVVEGCGITGELGEENGEALDRPHRPPSDFRKRAPTVRSAFR